MLHPDTNGPTPEALNSTQDEAVERLRREESQLLSEEQIRGYGEKLYFPDYIKILRTCRNQGIEADDVLVFLGAMTDESGQPIDRTINDIANLLIPRLEHQHKNLGRTLPEDLDQEPKQYFAGMFRFMLVQFSGNKPQDTPRQTRHNQNLSDTLPLIEIGDQQPGSVAAQDSRSVRLFDQPIGLSSYGKNMYFGLLLQLGNPQYNIAGNDKNLKAADFELDQTGKYREMFIQKLPGLKNHLASTHPENI